MTAPDSALVTPALLTLPAALAARVVANARLDACVVALEQMDAGAPEALHDLRVSLRRLRSWLRTFRPYLDDSVRRRTHQRLRRLVRKTNGARDLEVWGEWCAEQTDLAGGERAGARYLGERLASESKAAGERALDRVQRRLPKIIAALRGELATYSLHVRGGPAVDHHMSGAISDALRRGSRRLRRRAARIESLTDVEAIHATRIAAKKVRYVAETIESNREASEVAGKLSELQDLLGDVHDMQLLVVRLLGDIDAAAGVDARRRAESKVGVEVSDTEGIPPRRAVAGLTEIAVRAQRRAQSEFDRFMRDWSGEQLDELDAKIIAIADDLERMDE